jgi:hypothetical protein
MQDDTDSNADIDLENDSEINIEATDELARYVMDRYERARRGREPQERTMVTATQNFGGIISSDLQFSDHEKSRVFVKVTKTKVLAAYGLLIDILFPNNGHKFPVVVSPTPIPEGIDEAIHFDPKEPADEGAEMGAPEDIYGFPGDGNDLKPGDTGKSLLDRVGSMLKEKLSGVKKSVKEGPGETSTSATYFPADIAAAKMDKKMQDQFYEGKAHKALRQAVFESVLLGTGIIKGPYSRKKEYPKWVKQDRAGMGMKYEPVIKYIPSYEHISLWNFYPDPDARDEDDLGYAVIRHRLMRHQLIDLGSRVHFDKAAVNDAIADGPQYKKEWWEDDIDTDESEQASVIDRFEGLEYWGVIDAELAEEHGIEIPEEYEDFDVLQASIYVVNGHVIKAVVNPYRPTEMNFHAFRYEENPYSFFGVGLAENMADTQLLMNGFMRLGVDNAALSGNLVFEIDEDALVPGQDMTVYPGKTFRRQSGAPGQALFSHKFQNVSAENMQMFDKARQLADESTGLPSFAHGQTGVSGIGRTASGISMLMGAASTNIKTVLKNYDDALERMGRAQFSYDMQFEASDEDTIGDLEIKSRGTDQLMSNEIRSQRLMTFLNVGANQMLAPFMKFPYILREIAKSMDLDPERVTNSPEEAMRQAEMLKGMMVKMGGGAPGGGAGGGVPGAMTGDPTGSGGGNIGVGTAPGPGEQGFSGTPGGAGMGGEMNGQA